MSTFSWDEQNRRTALEGRQVLERTSASLARSNQVKLTFILEFYFQFSYLLITITTINLNYV